MMSETDDGTEVASTAKIVKIVNSFYQIYLTEISSSHFIKKYVCGENVINKMQCRIKI